MALGLQRDEVEVSIVEKGKRGFLGFGKKMAVVNLTPQKLATTTPTPQKQQDVLTAEKKDTRVQKKQELEKALLDLGEYLASITQKMGIQVTIDLTPSKHVAYYEFQTKQEGLLIGRRGKTLNALQLIAQDYLDKKTHHRVRVVLDVADYRQRRQETLEYLAQNVAQDALLEHRVMRLDPMPAYERKIIHSALAKEKNIKTYSQGSEPKRYVVIEPIEK